MSTLVSGTVSVSVTIFGQSNGFITNTLENIFANTATADIYLTGAPGNTASVYSNHQNISLPASTFGGNYDVMSNYSAYLNPTTGGTFSSSSKRTYSAFNGELAGGAMGQNLLYNGSVQSYGIGDAEMMLSDVRCWGGAYVSGTSSPTCNAVGEFGASDGNLVFTAVVSGSPGTSGTAITYSSGVNESVIGDRFLLDLTQTTTAGTVGSISGATVNTTSGPFWDATAAVCNGQSATVHCNPINEYFKVSSSDVSIGGVTTGHWYKVTGVASSTSLTLETSYDTTDLATSGAYVVAEGSTITNYNTTTKVLTVAANGWTWANADVIQSPPNSQYSLRGIYGVTTHTFKIGNPTVDDDVLSWVINGNPIDNGLIFSGTGGFRTGINFNTPIVQTGLSFGSAAGHVGTAIFFVDTALKIIGRNGGAGGSIGFVAGDTINWPTGGSDTVLGFNGTSHAITESIAGGTTFPLAQVISATSSAFATATTPATCVQNTTSVSGATTSMAVDVSPVSTPGVGAIWSGFVSSTGNVTINECAVAISAGGTIAFNIRVIP